MTKDLQSGAMTALVIALGIWAASAIVTPLMSRLGINQALAGITSGG
jgi:hypothetical protein